VKPAQVLLADPPWQFRDNLPGPKRGAAAHYQTIPVADIASILLPTLAHDCWLFLWRLHTHQREALELMKLWGFRYASEIVWVKTTKDNSRPRIGMGHTIRQSHEVCIVARRGRPAQLSKSCGSVIISPRREHSRKPDELYSLIESFAPGPYAEMFARYRRRGWRSFGAQLEPERAEAAE
jgi:N6-adenosine-specific RNA methylase IME4